MVKNHIVEPSRRFMIWKARADAVEFVKLASAWIEQIDKDGYSGSIYTPRSRIGAACKRASMDLSSALAALRQHGRSK